MRDAFILSHEKIWFLPRFLWILGCLYLALSRFLRQPNNPDTLIVDFEKIKSGYLVNFCLFLRVLLFVLNQWILSLFFIVTFFSFFFPFRFYIGYLILRLYHAMEYIGTESQFAFFEITVRRIYNETSFFFLKNAFYWIGILFQIPSHSYIDLWKIIDHMPDDIIWCMDIV